jgi:serine phosphatase RsbU (regulator of sigma subunit)/PAS domain-containing protein
VDDLDRSLPEALALPADQVGSWPGAPEGGLAEPDLVRFLETMPAAFCFLDAQWRFRYVNAEGERVMGRPRARLLGTPVWEAFPLLVGSVFEEAYRTAVSTGRPTTFEAAHPGVPDGWFEVRVWPGPDGLAVYLLDVTALGRLAQLVVPVLTDGCIVTVVDREGRARDVGSWHADPERRPLIDRYTAVRLETLPATSPVARALANGTSATESVAAVLALMPPGPARDLLQALRPEYAVVLPLTAGSRTVGVLTLYQDGGRVVGPADLDTARQVAAEAGRAVARVHRQSQQAQLAEALQRSLLTEPPQLGETDVVVRYVPAAEAARVGGDWYDAFLQRDGFPVVVIGDVVGHDTAAAAAMGQLRGLLRGIAHYSGAGPAEILRGLDEAMAHMHPETLATAAVARLERHPATGRPRLRWCNAGHPPPVVLAPDGDVAVLGGAMGDLMLGVDTAAERPESVVDLPPGTTVLLYTDGLVERRGSSLDEGMARLAGHLRELAGAPLDRLCDAVLERMLDGTPQDDVALVAVRVSAPCPRAVPGWGQAGAHPEGSGSEQRHG